MMTKNQYRRAIEAIGLNQIEAGRFLGISDRTSRNYAALGAPDVVKMLLMLMIEKRISVRTVNRIAGRKART